MGILIDLLFPINSKILYVGVGIFKLKRRMKLIPLLFLELGGYTFYDYPAIPVCASAQKVLVLQYGTTN